MKSEIVINRIIPCINVKQKKEKKERKKRKKKKKEKKKNAIILFSLSPIF